jgi:NAD-dependent deacetylase
MTKIVTSVGDARAELSRWIGDAEHVAAFTGAGISTESGIPDFRSKDSLWKRHPPIPFNEFMSSETVRMESWRRKFVMDDSYKGAAPNVGHHALARLVDDGRMHAVITQNIDGLHEASGIPKEKIIELHGNGTYAKCLGCGVRHELSAVRKKFESSNRAPTCLCGGIVKTATIAFGQAMPEDEMRRAHAATLQCDLMLAIGSSLVVYPAASFPVLAKESGAGLIIINRDETPLDGIADLVIRAGIGDVLAPFAGKAD